MYLLHLQRSKCDRPGKRGNKLARKCNLLSLNMGMLLQADYTHNNAQHKWAKNESPEERVLRDCLENSRDHASRFMMNEYWTESTVR
jgi:hypothetical protein